MPAKSAAKLSRMNSQSPPYPNDATLRRASALHPRYFDKALRNYLPHRLVETENREGVRSKAHQSPYFGFFESQTPPQIRSELIEMAAHAISVRHAKLADVEFVHNCITTQREEAPLQVTETGNRRHDWTCSRDDLNIAIEQHEILIAEIDDDYAGFVWFRETMEYPFGVGYGKWDSPLYWIQAGYTLPQFRRRGIARTLHAKLEQIARESGIQYMWCNLYFKTGPDPIVLERIGYKPRTIVQFQDTTAFLEKHEKTSQRYAEKWQGWSARSANASDIDWIVRGIADIYTVEQRPPRDDMSPEIEIVKDLITRDEMIVAVDADQSRLGFLAFTNAEEFPYGSGFYGKWFQQYIWALYVWVDSNQRGCGIASYLYGKLFERAAGRGKAEIGLDVFNVNETSMKFHQNGVGFQPEVQVFVKDLGNKFATSSA